jgi:hypothetical protein
MLTFHSGSLVVLVGVHRFLPGALHVSPAVTQLEQQGHLFTFNHLANHLKGDWGHVDAEVRQRNETALRTGGPLFSRYPVADGRNLCIATSPDRHATTLRLDNEPATS